MGSMQNQQILSISLALFAMLFGAGNLIYPLQVGMTCGDVTIYGILGFMLTAVCLPFVGLACMLLFDGNYKAFFYRLGTFPGGLLLFISMMMIGPVLAIPRIVTLTYTMLIPLLPVFLSQVTLISSLVFAFLFLGLTFLTTFRERKIVTILGNVISPLLLISLGVIIGVGWWHAQSIAACDVQALTAFKANFIRGYETLDLISAIFFSSIIISLLKRGVGSGYNPRVIALIGLQACLIGLVLLAITYVGLTILGVYHGQGLEHLNAGELLRDIAFKVLGSTGLFLVGIATLMACLSTAIALSAVVAEYVEHTLFRGNIRFATALVMVLVASVPLSIAGLGKVLQLAAGPIVYIAYPVLIALTICNIAYKLVGFKAVKLPVLITFVVALVSYLW